MSAIGLVIIGLAGTTTLRYLVSIRRLDIDGDDTIDDTIPTTWETNFAL